jgi:DNA repair exonuclease SbcCD ATPase subunit
MWIERVVAHAFGPLLDRTLELAPGLTVVTGPNEAGKSSWHAATRLAITGVRRGRGSATRDAIQTVEQHRPWDRPDRWEVEARLHLADGRIIDMRQDLAGKVACRAVDVALGEDVSAEIMDGTPDASRWLGLDRDAFAATVCVDQADILAVAEHADALQDDMQRAASSTAEDATAAEAIANLIGFRKAAVGADTVAAKGPLRAAIRAREAAEVARAEAARRHAAFLDRLAEADAADHRLSLARGRLAQLEAVAALRRAEAAEARLARAQELAARYPEAPAPLDARDELADAVATAIEGWRRRPRPPVLSGATSDELEEALARLPHSPTGDQAPHENVTHALWGLERSTAALEGLGELPPAIEASSQPRGNRVAMATALLAAATLVGGVVAWLAAMPQISAALVTLAAILAGGALIAWGRHRRSFAGVRATQALASALGEEWKRRRAEAAAELAAAEAALRAALEARGAPADGDVREAEAAYEAACAQRARQATEASEADRLRERLEARRAAEALAAEAARAADDAAASLATVARDVGAESADDPDALVTNLDAWRSGRRAALRAAEGTIREWQELTALLGDGSLDDLRADATEQRLNAERLVAVAGLEAAERRDGLGSRAVGGLGDLRDAESEIAHAREEAADAQEAAARLAGELRALQAGLPDVAAAEEAVAVARSELHRVHELAATIDQALDLLRNAQRRVHRDLAPVLRTAIQRWLPTVTGGAYVEAGVNPADLSIDVKEAASGAWREARLLSQGTREQIYLLLRVAMAEHLVTTGETAPLLLDEVTAQSDPERKLKLLETLHALSAERQIVLFSHDAEVAAWAARALRRPRDRLVPLAAPIAPVVAAERAPAAEPAPAAA